MPPLPVAINPFCLLINTVGLLCKLYCHADLDYKSSWEEKQAARKAWGSAQQRQSVQYLLLPGSRGARKREHRVQRRYTQQNPLEMYFMSLQEAKSSVSRKRNIFLLSNLPFSCEALRLLVLSNVS